MSIYSQLEAKHYQAIESLQEKLEPVGQNLICHLESLYHTKFLNYWDYAQLDILLKLQNPKTAFPDEMIFIAYHQITELYFKLILWETDQITKKNSVEPAFFAERIVRVNRYLNHTINSFDIMLEGLDREQFLMFRKALVPASGFQSLQFRLIELSATNLENLLKSTPHVVSDDQECSLADQYEGIYWKQGTRDLNSDHKDMSLLEFEREYDGTLLNYAGQLQGRNLYAVFKSFSSEDAHYSKICKELRSLDYLINVKWKLIHFKTAVKHLHMPDQVVRATGGSNWRQYLPPRFQKIIFYPSLWTATEKEEWGRNFIEEILCEK